MPANGWNTLPLNIKIQKNVRIPENLQMKFEWKINNQIVKLPEISCERRLRHRTRSHFV